MHVYALHDGTKATEARATALAAALKSRNIHVCFFRSLARNSLRPATWDACLVLLSREYLRQANEGKGDSAVRALFDASMASSVPKIVVALEATLPTQLPGAVGDRLGSPMVLPIHQDPECVELERVIRLQRPRAAFRGACKRIVARNRLVLLTPSAPKAATEDHHRGGPTEFRARVRRIAVALEIPSTGEHLSEVVDRAVKTLRLRCGSDDLFCERVAKVEKQLGFGPCAARHS